MKKIISVLVAGLLMFSLGLFVLAQEETPDEETNNQVADMANKSGSEIRLMQLEAAIEKNVIAGEEVVEDVLNDTPEANVSGLNSLIAELEVLEEEVSSMIDSVDENENSSELADDFVTIKTEAMQLSREFHMQANEMLPENAKEKVRERIRNQTGQETEEKRERIQEKTREHNAEQVKKVLGVMGEVNETLVEKVRDGEMNVGQAVSSVAQKYRGLGEEQRGEAKARINEQKAEKRVRGQAMMEQAKEGLQERMRNRVEERKEHVEQKLEQVRQRVMEKSSGKAKEMIEKRMNAGNIGGPGRDSARDSEDNETADSVNETGKEDGAPGDAGNNTPGGANI